LLLQIRDKKWGDTGSRACYLRKSTTTFEIGNNDYSELGLLQQQQQQQHQQQQQQMQQHQQVNNYIAIKHLHRSILK
jgi:hypothetical protein